MSAITSDTGAFFSILLKSIRARRALEIGTSSGYSTLWIADALLSEPRGRPSIVTVEADPAKIKWATANFKKAGTDSITRIMHGGALEILRRLECSRNSFDFVLIDADKENVIEYFDLVLPMVRKGGIIATDNMLYPEHFRPIMKKFSTHVKRNPLVQTVTVPIGNGEEITMKLG